MKAFLCALLLTVALSFAGCSSSPSIVGKWKVDPEFAKEIQPKLPMGYMSGFSRTFAYEYFADKTFKGILMDGVYTLDNNKVTMDYKTLSGKDLSTMGIPADSLKMTGELSTDGKSLTLHPPSGGLMPDGLKDVKMTRATS